MADIKLKETGDGGDAIFNGTDIETIEGFENMPFIGISGGNIEENTKEYLDGEQRFSWWGNNLLMLEDQSIQFNSDFERLLNNIELSSSSRIQIEETIKSDLAFMSDFSGVEVSVSIVSVDRIRILIKLQQPDNEQSQEFVYIWDATKNELLNNG